MSDLLNIYLKSANNIVVEAKQIPDRAVNFTDINNEISDNFKTFTKRSDGTQFTPRAINEHDEQLNSYTPPADFVQLDPDIPPNRWNYQTKYYNPGQSIG